MKGDSLAKFGAALMERLIGMQFVGLDEARFLTFWTTTTAGSARLQ